MNVFVIHTKNKYDEHYFDVYEGELDAVNECHNIIGEFISTLGDDEDAERLQSDWENWDMDTFYVWDDWLADHDCSIEINETRLISATKKAKNWAKRKEVGENVTKNIKSGRGDKQKRR